MSLFPKKVEYSFKIGSYETTVIRA